MRLRCLDSWTRTWLLVAEDADEEEILERLETGADWELLREVLSDAADESDALQEPLPPLCSICRRRHGSEVQHACE